MVNLALLLFSYAFSFFIYLLEATPNYLDSLLEVNKELSEKHKGEKWVPIIPPPTGNISGIDRTIYYYSKGDSVVDFLSQ